MKKKFAMLVICLTGMAVLSLSACGADTNTNDTESTTQESEQSDSTGSAGDEAREGASDTHEETTRVSDRPDYVSIQDLDIEEYVTLCDYANMTVEVQRGEITDDLIESLINTNLMRITKGEVKTGDILNIDFVGKRDGVAFSGGTASGYELEIGSGTFIPGFEDGLIGAAVGDTVDLDLTFPEDYGNTELAGVDVVFTVTVNSIVVHSDYASITDEELQSLGMDYESKEELWAAGMELAGQTVQEAYDISVKSAAVTKVIQDSTIISVPDYLVEEEAESYLLYMNGLCQSMQVDLETYVAFYYGITIEDYEEEIREMSRASVEAYLVYEALARAEGITVTDAQIMEQANKEAADYGYSTGEELINEVGYTVFRMYVVQELVVDRLIELVTVADTNTSTEGEAAN